MHLHAVGYTQKPEDTSDHRDRVYLYFIRKDEASRVCVSSPRNLRSLQKVESVANHAAEETELSLIYDYKFCCRLGSANTIRCSSFFPSLSSHLHSARFLDHCHERKKHRDLRHMNEFVEYSPSANDETLAIQQRTRSAETFFPGEHGTSCIFS